MKRVVIVGAGISGLALAYRLEQLSADLQVTILEQADRPGGAAWTLRENGFQVEIGPNGFLDTKPTTLALAREIGLGDKLLPASDASARNRFLFVDGRLQPLPGSLSDVLRSGLLSWRGKLNLFLERWRRPPNQMPADESVATFARRRAGKEIAELLADALVTGIYAGDPRRLSLPACFPRVKRFEMDFGSVSKGFAVAARRRRLEATTVEKTKSAPGRMWSFAEGMRLLSERLAGALKQPPLFSANARRILMTGDPARPTWEVHGDCADRWSAEALVLACPAYRQAGLLADLDIELAEEVGAIPYNRVAVVALGYRREDVPGNLDGFGFIAPQKFKRDLLGAQWCSSIFPARAPDGAVLLRALCGGWQRPDVLTWDDAKLLDAVRNELRLAQGIVAAPIFHKIIRWDRAIPQYHVGHLERLERIDRRLTEHPGLFLAGNAYRGVALNDCTEEAGILAQRIDGRLR
ncbi:MAG: protoporphyrinogen oxidase [Planctomycetes bacterium]|nr:protoporphyrinogen oxidase [Planctomycetota bacterium]